MAFTVVANGGSGFGIADAGAVRFADSANIATGGGTATTARLTAPAGKTTGNFTAGKISDDTNPVTVDIGANGYTEVEWCIKLDTGLAVGGDVYEFRVVVDDAPLSTYTVTPQLTAAVAAAALSADCLCEASFTTGPLNGIAAALSGAAANVAAMTGSLTTGIPLSAAAANVASSTGSLTTGIPLSASMANVADATGSLTTGIPLSASVLSQADATASLTTLITLFPSGAERVTNGDFSNGTGWVFFHNSTGGISGGQATVEWTSGSNAEMRQNIKAATGELLRVTFDLVSEVGNGLAYARFNVGANVLDFQAVNSYSPGSYLFDVVSPSDNPDLRFLTYAAAPNSFVLDNVSVRQLAFEVSASMTGDLSTGIQLSTLGPTLISGGTFDSAVGWNVNGEASIGSGVARIYSSAGAFSAVSQTAAFVEGETYLVEFDVLPGGTGSGYVYLGDGVGGPWRHDFSGATPGKVSQLLVGGAGTLAGIVRSVACDFSVDNFSVRLVEGSRASVTSDLTTGIPLSASAASIAAMTGSLTTGIPLAAAMDAQADATASLTTAIRLSASAVSEAAATGDLTVGVFLSAAAGTVADMTGNLTVGVFLNADAGTVADMTASLTVGVFLDAAMVSQADMAANLTVGVLLDAAMASQADMTASLTVGVLLDGAAAAQADMTGSLTTGIPLAAAAAGVAAMTGSLTTGIPLAASAASLAAMTASLTTGIPLSAAAASQAAMTADVTVFHRVIVDAAVVAVTGREVALAATDNHFIPVTPAVVTVIGQEIGLSVTEDAFITVEPASVTLTGQDVRLEFPQSIAVEPAAVTFAGQAIPMRLAAPIAPASVSTTGQPIGMQVSMPVVPAAITVTGQNVNLSATNNYRIRMDHAPITLRGSVIDLRVSNLLKLFVDPVAIRLTGKEVNLGFSYRMAVAPAAVTVQGQEIGLKVTAPVTPDTARVSGRPIPIKLSMQVEPASVRLIGSDVKVIRVEHVRMQVEPAGLSMIGVNIRLIASNVASQHCACIEARARSADVTVSAREVAVAAATRSATVTVSSRTGLVSVSARTAEVELAVCETC